MRFLKWIIAGAVALVIVIVGGTWLYIHTSNEPEKLTLDATPGGTTAKGSGGGAPLASVDGTWKPTSASQAGYRVKETLFGQSNEAVGRTNAVTGDVTINGTKVPSASFTVDLTSVKSDKDGRDSQFKNRIMNVSQFPTATFKLTQPIDMSAVPADGEAKTVKATGDLTLHGKTKSVTVDLQTQRNGNQIQIVGSIPITFADFGINNPSGGPAQTEDNGQLEVKLVLEKA